MEKMINELIYLKNCSRPDEGFTEENMKNCKKFNKLFMKAAKLYADFYGRDISEGMLYVSAQIG